MDLNLTFVQTPSNNPKGTNGNLTITCLSATNVSTQVVTSGIFWPTWPGSMWVFARMFSSTTFTKAITTEHVPPLLVFQEGLRILHCSNWLLKMPWFCNSQIWKSTRDNQNYDMVRVWIAWQVQVFANIRDQLNYNWLSMSGWQYGEQMHPCDLWLRARLWCSVRLSSLQEAPWVPRSKFLGRDCQKCNPCPTQVNFEYV